MFPLVATSQGDNRYNDRQPNDQTRAFRPQQVRFYRHYLNDLLNIDRARLRADDKLSYDIFQYEMRSRLEGLRLNTWMMPFAQFYSLPTTLSQLGAGTGAQPFRTVRDYNNWLARVGRFPVWADSAIGNFRQGARTGVVLPQVLVLKMVPQLQAQITVNATKSLFYKPITRLPDNFSDADCARLTPSLPRLFGLAPKSPFEIRQTEAFRAATASAEYNRGTPDDSRPGIFYVPILDATKFNVTSGMKSLFLHEAIPGHHYQLSLQQENTGLPKFRRFASYPAFSEGWALYCESLGKELGLYTDPYQRIGALGDEMHRALRLVVDVGLHLKGMSREQAIDYMMANEPISEQAATAEIERYMALPGQALAYKTGQLKIQELRTRYETQLGKNFSLKDFHDEILAGGSMPLAVLERRMDAWAVRQR